jgi:hypothetical protein
MKTRSGTRLSRGDYVGVKREVIVEQFGTSLRIAPGSVGRVVKDAWNPEEIVVLFANWHVRVPRSHLSHLSPPDSVMPFPWVDRFLAEVQSRSMPRQGERA